MSTDSNGGDSPFPAPRMECRGCGKEPHGGYCYPVLDGLIGVLLVFAICVAVPIIVVVLSESCGGS